MQNIITKDDVIKAQNGWGKGIVNIGKAYLEKSDYEKLAIEHINNFYDYEGSNVLFKPTRASKDQFRETKERALSYFVATNKACNEDLGFALMPWTSVEFDNHNIEILDSIAIAMGNYTFVDLKGESTIVEYSFVYKKTAKNQLKIILHHSSLPFS